MNGNFRFKKAELGLFNTKDATNAVTGLKKDCHIMGLTMGEFSLIDLVRVTLDIIGPSELNIATWSAGIKDVHQVKWMLDTKLITSVKLLTDHSYATRQKKYAASIEDIFGVENIRTSEMHAKFVLIGNADWNVTIISSMNLNANRTCETFTIYENKEIYDFYYEFITHHFNDMGEGFEESSSVVSKSLARFFNGKSENKTVAPKHWSEM